MTAKTVGTSDEPALRPPAPPPTRDQEEKQLEEEASKLRTVGEAADYVRGLLDERIEEARVAKALPNSVLPGDGAARSAFYTLLPPAHQREIFLEVVSHVETWPRVRSLFGAPPYGFLLPSDASYLNARGFAAGRANMAYDATTAAAGYSHFGSGQLVDKALREYNIVSHGRAAPKDDTPLLCDIEQTPLGDIVLQVRVKRVKRQERVNIIRDKEKRVQLTFPVPGEELLLRQTDKIRKLLLVRGEGTVLRVRVKRTVPRAENSSTAALLVTVQ